MSALTGFFLAKNTKETKLTARIKRMNATLTHRGPEHVGDYLEAAVGLAIGYRHHGLVRETPENQPSKTSASGRFHLVYSGDPTNTTTLLARIEKSGLKDALKSLSTTFTFALWDKHEQTLTIGRDHVGDQPLYYGQLAGDFVFGSELKALLAGQEHRPEINRRALDLFIRHGVVPTPFSIYEGIHKLEPGCFLTIKNPQDTGKLTRYWDAAQAVTDGLAAQFTGTDTQAIDQLETLLLEILERATTADVPVGSFLSGGIDSSLLVSLMQKVSKTPVPTFSIGFAEAGYNEATDAARIAKHLGTDHHELYVTAEQAQAVISQLPTIYDEPFADASQIPTFLVSQLAKKTVGVAMSGDGGDENFAGYNRHLWAPRVWATLGKLPAPLRTATARGLFALPAPQIDAAYQRAERFIPARAQIRLPADKIHKLAGLLAATTTDALYARLTSQWQDPAAVVIGATGTPHAFTHEPATENLTERIMYRDLTFYVLDDGAVKVERASAANGLKVRTPLLDHELIEFAWRLPMHLKIRNGQGKWILRQLLSRQVPTELFERPKSGFGVPIGDWLRGPLRPWADELLNPDRLHSEGFFHPAPITRTWHEHLSGTRNAQHQLWNILMFQAWLDATNSTFTTRSNA